MQNLSPLPTSIRPLRGSVATHVQPPPRTSWQLAEAAQWAHPTALDFEQRTIESSKVTGHARISGESLPIPPQILVDLIDDLWNGVRHFLLTHHHVVDCGEQQGIRFEFDPAVHQGVLFVRQKTWPAIEGVTAPRTDGDSTW